MKDCCNNCEHLREYDVYGRPNTNCMLDTFDIAEMRFMDLDESGCGDFMLNENMVVE